MAIVYPLEFPSNNLRRVNFRCLNAASMSRNPYTFDHQIQAYTGQSWILDVTLPPMTRNGQPGQDAAEEWIAFLLALEGMVGSFRYTDPKTSTPRGNALGTPVVNGAGQTGKYLVTDGWINDETVLKKGDALQLGDHYHRVLEDIVSDGSGNATISLYPRLRESPEDNYLIITEGATGIFRLSSNDVDVYSIGMERTYDVSFSAFEVINTSGTGLGSGGGDGGGDDIPDIDV